MDFDEYRKNGKEMVDYIADYLQTIRRRRVFPAVQPGYMCELIPENAPVEGENWPDIFADIERVIMPGMTHWQSPHMHAYFPALTSFPSMMGDMLADAINCIGFTWASAPAATELETLVMDWLAQMLGLPEKFWHFPKGHTALDDDGKRVRGQGGGVIQTTASEATFIALMAGRTEAFRRYRHAYEQEADGAEINTRLVGYCSDQAHSSVEKAALMGLVKMRFLRSEPDTLALRGETLMAAIEEDKAAGLIPFFVCATLGTTGACAFDRLDEIGEVCKAHDLWLHVDAAYAGTAFICPEFRHHMRGIEHGSSFAFNPSKWMMVSFDCTAMWVADAHALHRTFNVNPLYLKHENSGSAIDYMHWQIGLSKRFRALKLWFVIRSFGVRGLQEHIRKGVKLAQQFEALVAGDTTFELAAKRHLGLVVFRLAGENVLTEKLLKKLNSTGLVHMVPASLQGRYVIRYTVTSQYTELQDILRDWTIIQQVARDVRSSLAYVGPLQQQPLIAVPRPLPMVRITAASDAVVPAAGAKTRMTMNGGVALLGDKRYGTSLLLANSPYSPKFVNGSFAALFDDPEYAADFAKAYGKQLKRIQASSQGGGKSGSTKRRAWALGKQYSLDSRMERIVEFIKPYLPKLLEQSPTEEELQQQSLTDSAKGEKKLASLRKTSRGAQSRIAEEEMEEQEEEDKSSIASSVACSSSASSSTKSSSSILSSISSRGTTSSNITTSTAYASQSATPCKSRSTTAAAPESMTNTQTVNITELGGNRSRSKSVDIDTLAGVAVEWLQKLGLVNVSAAGSNNTASSSQRLSASSKVVELAAVSGAQQKAPADKWGSRSSVDVCAEQGAEVHEMTVYQVGALKPALDTNARPGSAQ